MFKLNNIIKFTGGISAMIFLLLTFGTSTAIASCKCWQGLDEDFICTNAKMSTENVGKTTLATIIVTWENEKTGKADVGRLSIISNDQGKTYHCGNVTATGGKITGTSQRTITEGQFKECLKGITEASGCKDAAKSIIDRLE